jgi:hypothetical protein
MSRIAATVLAAAVPVTLLASAGAASASPAPQQVRAATFITDRPDGGNAGYWADDTMNRTLVITRTGGTTGDWTFKATLTDDGAFTTIKGAQVPNQAAPWTGETIRSAVTGLMTGYANFTFTASKLPSSSLVPRFENDHGNVPADDTSTWYMLAFPAGTTFGGAGIGNWGWTYLTFTRTGLQFWADTAANGYGDLAGDGQITG